MSKPRILLVLSLVVVDAAGNHFIGTDTRPGSDETRHGASGAAPAMRVEGAPRAVRFAASNFNCGIEGSGFSRSARRRASRVADDSVDLLRS
jgi:hypothetical protein